MWDGWGGALAPPIDEPPLVYTIKSNPYTSFCDCDKCVPVTSNASFNSKCEKK